MSKLFLNVLYKHNIWSYRNGKVNCTNFLHDCANIYGGLSCVLVHLTWRILTDSNYKNDKYNKAVEKFKIQIPTIQIM